MRDAHRRTPLVVASALGGVLIVAVIAGLPPFLLAAIPVIYTVAVTVIAPWFGVAALVALLPFNGLATDLLEHWGMTEVALIMGAGKDVVLVTLLVMSIVTGEIRRARPELLILVGLIVSLSGIAGVQSESFAQAVYGWRNDYEPLLLIACVPVLLTAATASRIAAIIIGVGQLSSAIALATWSMGTDWLYTIGRLPVAEGERFPTSLFVSGSELPRAFSPYTAPNEMAAALLITLAVIVCTGRWRWYFRAALTVLPILAIVAAQSRSGLLGLAALTAILVAHALYKVRPVFGWAFASVSAIVAAVAVLLYTQANATSQDSDPSLGGHSDSLLEAFELLMAQPFGYGLGTVGPRAFRFSDDPILVESFVLLIALEAGVIVFALYLALLFRLTQLSIRSSTRAGLVGAAAIAATLVSQLVLPTLQEGAVSFLLWIVAGMGVFLSQQKVPPEKVSQAELD